MTLNDIKAMFTPGSTWTAVRTPPMPPGSNAATLYPLPRVVKRVGSKDIVFTVSGADFYTPIPRAIDVIEAREGFLSFRLPKMPDVSVALTKVTS